MTSNLPAPYVIQRLYHDFDHLVSDMRKWDLDLLQIDRGLFQGEVLQFGIGDTHVAEGRFGRVLEQRGAPPAGLRTIGIPANQNVRFIWRGQQVVGNNLIVFPRGAELASVSSPEFHIYTCSFPEDLLASLSEGLLLGELDRLRGSSEVISCRPDLMNQLQNQMRALCDSVRREEKSLCQRDIQHDLTFALPRQLLRTIAASTGVCVPASSQKRELAVAEAQAYLERHARDSISVKDLGKAAGVSQRTLEYAFDERFGLTPKAFLLAFRLNMVRKELRAADPSTTKIVEIANDYGFWHMGRFAAHYQRLFQELPSTTLRQSSAGWTTG
jgi:AraC family ethanolamine operon transcriptional activator